MCTQMQLWASLLAGMCRVGQLVGEEEAKRKRAVCRSVDGAVCCADRLDHELKTSRW